MKKVLNRIYRVAMPLLVFLCVLLFVLRLVGVSVIFVRGESMEPNYSDGELHLISKADEYKRGDVVAVQVDNMVILKRIIAIEGDTVEIYHHCIWVNSELITPYITSENWNGSGEFDTCQTIGKNRVFLLGDQRNASADSRQFGSISTDRIIGRVIQ